jgi:hypothetical protein
VDVDVEIDFINASLLFLVAAAFPPRAIPQRSTFNLRQVEALPIAAGW